MSTRWLRDDYGWAISLYIIISHNILITKHLHIINRILQSSKLLFLYFQPINLQRAVIQQPFYECRQPLKVAYRWEIWGIHKLLWITIKNVCSPFIIPRCGRSSNWLNDRQTSIKWLPGEGVGLLNFRARIIMTSWTSQLMLGIDTTPVFEISIWVMQPKLFYWNIAPSPIPIWRGEPLLYLILLNKIKNINNKKSGQSGEVCITKITGESSLATVIQLLFSWYFLWLSS